MEHNANQALALYPHLPPTHTHTHTHTGQKTPSNECQELYKDINFASPFYLPDSSSFPSLSSLPLVLILWQHHLPNGAISSCGTTVVFVLSSYTSHSCFPYAQTSSQIPHPLWPIIFRTSWLCFFFFFCLLLPNPLMTSTRTKSVVPEFQDPAKYPGSIIVPDLWMVNHIMLNDLNGRILSFQPLGLIMFEPLFKIKIGHPILACKFIQWQINRKIVKTK